MLQHSYIFAKIHFNIVKLIMPPVASVAKGILSLISINLFSPPPSACPPSHQQGHGSPLIEEIIRLFSGNLFLLNVWKLILEGSG